MPTPAAAARGSPGHSGTLEERPCHELPKRRLFWLFGVSDDRGSSLGDRALSAGAAPLCAGSLLLWVAAVLASELSASETTVFLPSPIGWVAGSHFPLSAEHAEKKSSSRGTHRWSVRPGSSYEARDVKPDMEEIVRTAVDMGLSLTTPENVDRAYRRAAREVHPDKPGGRTAAFQALLEAKERLKDDLSSSRVAPAAARGRRRRRTASPPRQHRGEPIAAAWVPPGPDLRMLPFRDLFRLALEEQQQRPLRLQWRIIPPPQPGVVRVMNQFSDWRPGSWVGGGGSARF
jgi:hypothetical protein